MATLLAMPLASMVVTCKGRLHHLRKTIHAILSQEVDFEYELIVVDYGCPQGTFDWCMALNHRQVVAVRVLTGTNEFSRSRAKNCGAVQARGQVLAFIDADIRPQRGWLSQVTRQILQGGAGFSTVARFRNGWDCGGTLAVDASLFQQVRGYDEALSGWGNEDSDIYARCGQHARHASFNSGLLCPIRHSHVDRVRFHRQKSLDVSCRSNAEYLAARTTVNPDGFGLGSIEIHRGQSVISLSQYETPHRQRILVRSRKVTGN